MAGFDYQTWMPPSLTTEEKDHFTELHPDDPHAAAAAAWDAYAGTLEAQSAASSMSTGAQSVSYSGRGGGPANAAIERADYHRARARVRSVIVGPDHTVEGPTFGEERTGLTEGDDTEVYGDAILWGGASR